MTKFKRVLSDSEIHDLFALDNDVFRADSDGNFYTQGGHYFLEAIDLFEIGRKLEQAVLAKLAEQEPVAWYVNDRSITAAKIVADHWSETGSIVKPLYAHPRQTPLSDQEQRIDKPMLVGNTVFTTKVKAQTVLDAAARHYNLMRTPEREAERIEIGNLKMDYWRKRNHMPSELETLKHWIGSKEKKPVGYLHANGISFLSSRRTTAEQARAEDYSTPLYTNPCDSQNEKYETQIPDGTLINEGTKNHDVEPSNITKLSLSVDTKEAQALLQSYLDSLKDWQLVPKEPSRDTLKRMFYEIFGMDGIDEEYLAARYRNMLSLFPKYTEVIND